MPTSSSICDSLGKIHFKMKTPWKLPCYWINSTNIYFASKLFAIPFNGIDSISLNGFPSSCHTQARQHPLALMSFFRRNLFLRFYLNLRFFGAYWISRQFHFHICFLFSIQVNKRFSYAAPSFDTRQSGKGDASIAFPTHRNRSIIFWPCRVASSSSSLPKASPAPERSLPSRNRSAI